jgi:hypothetical protein
MIKDGKYAAWFRTSRGQGTGIVYLANGKISGGDSVITYGGSYELDENHFRATLTTRRHAAGQPSVFGLDEVEVKLTGMFNGTIASCSGRAEQAPELVFEATLILSRDHPSVPDVKRASVNFVPSELPKRFDDRSGARSAFAPERSLRVDPNRLRLQPREKG